MTNRGDTTREGGDEWGMNGGGGVCLCEYGMIRAPYVMADAQN